MSLLDRIFGKSGAPDSPEREVLFDIELDEISFVDAGDNPEAHVAMFKRDQGDELISEAEIESIIEDVAKELPTDRGSMTTKTFTKKADAAAEIDRLALEKSQAEGIDFYKAYERVLEEHHTLYEQYRELPDEAEPSETPEQAEKIRKSREDLVTESMRRYGMSREEAEAGAVYFRPGA